MNGWNKVISKNKYSLIHPEDRLMKEGTDIRGKLEANAENGPTGGTEGREE